MPTKEKSNILPSWNKTGYTGRYASNGNGSCFGHAFLANTSQPNDDNLHVLTRIQSWGKVIWSKKAPGDVSSEWHTSERAKYAKTTVNRLTSQPPLVTACTFLHKAASNLSTHTCTGTDYLCAEAHVIMCTITSTHVHTHTQQYAQQHFTDKHLSHQ